MPTDATHPPAPLAALIRGAIALLALAAPAIAQGAGEGDRLALVRDLTRNSELALIWSEDDGAGTHRINHRIYDLDLAQSDLTQRLVPMPVHEDEPAIGPRTMAIATGNVTGTSYEHFVSAWTAADGAVTLAVPHLDPEALAWTDVTRLTVPGPAAAATRVRLAVGDFCGAGVQDEVILAYEGADGTLRLQAYGFPHGSLEPKEMGALNTGALVEGRAAWDLAAGDFDLDGREELAVLAVRPDAAAGWAVQAHLYRVSPDGAFLPGPEAAVFPAPGYPVQRVDLSATAGDFDAEAALEIAVAFTFEQEEPGPDTYLYVLDVTPDLGALLTADSMRVARDVQNEADIRSLNLATGDLDAVVGEAAAKLRDEIVLTTGGAWHAYTVTDALRPEPWRTGGGGQPSGFGDSDRYLAVDDVDGDGQDEIVLAGSFVDEEPNGAQYLTLHVIGLNQELMPRVLARREVELPVSNDRDARHFALALGDFDADRLRLGTPVHYRRTGILQPSVVLYTPPVHYDVLDGTAHDLSGCFPDQGCGFTATYTQTSTSERTVTLEQHVDWGASVAVTAEYGLAKQKVAGTYGEKYSNTLTDRETVTISTGRTAEGDDWIYASLFDIDFYEYPVFDGDDPEPVGHFMVSRPGAARPLWIEGKDDELLGNQFRPDHEVGNVLSYRRTDAPDLDGPIVVFPEQTIGSTGSSFALLQLDTFSEVGASTSWDAGLTVTSTFSPGVDIFGVELGAEIEAEGTFAAGEIVTQTVSVQEALEVRADFGHLETEYGTSGTYQIEPYAYWTVYGALALDYRVTLPEGPTAFWSAWYGGRSDAGFSLPWRYDAHKGLPLPDADASYAQRTRDVVLSKSAPLAGDTVRAIARVRNLGLAALADPVTVDFYLGDPTADGVLLGTTATDSTIAPQGSENVFVDWVVPAATPLQDRRIYVVLDAAGTLTDQVHANNDVGWAPAVALGRASTGTTEPGAPPLAFRLRPPYPNPALSVATVALEVPEAAHVTLTVYDVTGRVLAVLADEVVSAGAPHYRLDAAQWPSGLYLCRLVARPLRASAGAVRETRKLVLIR